ncbi:FMN-dependent NADH-azoreductase [Bradyrhizobium sp. CCBAU 53340]|uniref:FMN-dependent NADH-azoreductase n=1 Tax=Bradyrhizobium sp. CCBAU 53340 TaxID=1325112 RepID=UPI00188AF404|nr:FMN-dependent NADH-azoreductase [Bradyrhizobium sp. CCBAU 53340]QOZ44711.1 FMN-dependent NADH-azoreductase [Bradyrhizobium sp. CCBAU 53340]
MKLLHVDASILGGQSASRQLSAAIVERLTVLNPDTQVVRYDLAAEPIGHLTGPELLVQRGSAPEDAATKESAARNSKALDDFVDADVIVIGAPMYNFSLPSQLKAWLDRVAVPGKTFRYTANGVEGLAQGKRVIIASSRGNLYLDGQPAAGFDHQEKYLKSFFTFLGVSDVTVIRAEGLGRSPENRTAALAAAAAEIENLAVVY